MKKVVLLVGIILFVNFISAGYNCSEGLMTEGHREIDLYNTKNTNGLSLGLVYADEASVFGRYYAQFLLDAVGFYLNESVNFTEVEMKSGTNTISLVNVTSGDTYIKVDGDTEEIELQSVQEINNREVFLIKVEGAYPGIAIVEGIIGEGKIMLSNIEPIKIVTVDGADYLLELLSASDVNAIIKVGKCENESIEIIEINGTVITSITDVNDTSIENETVINNTNVKNETSNQTSEEEIGKSKPGIVFNKEFFLKMKGSSLSFIILTVVIAIGIISFLIIRFLNSLNLPYTPNIGGIKTSE